MINAVKSAISVWALAASPGLAQPRRKAMESMGCIQDCFLLRQVQDGNQARFRSSRILSAILSELLAKS
jgi:hypothetical protein